ncbi:hypothetical protein LVJ94_52160 [Pendulispora rubella]|uniref:Outer membrane protein beta-barrel domain-containing protein n=2 Tax=Pendulispora rubella TaxID=2741070 RepID=A0ABZ2L3A5_9BACT
MRCIVAMAAAILGLSTVASEARAEPGDLGRGFDLGKLIDQGVHLFYQSTQTRGTNTPSDVTTRLRAPSLVELEAMFPSRDPAVRDGLVRAGTLEFAHVGTMGTPAGVDKGTSNEHDPKKSAFQPALRLSLIARDWKGAISLVGRGAVPSDQIRLTRSSRMLIGRVTVGTGPLVPFVHVGAGEWRYDPDLQPFTPRNQEFATQFGAGVAVRISKHMSFAWETDYVILCRERREPQNVPNPYIIGSFGVLNVEY